MNRYLLWGTLTAALVLFVWQTVSNTLLPWHTMSLREFEEPGMLVGAMDIAAPENGLYYHQSGIVAAVSIVPGVADKSSLLGSMLLRQFVFDIIAAFLLAVVVARLALTPRSAATALGGVALAAGIILELSDWNWYGFPFVYALVNTVDVAINGALAGLVLGWFARRFRPATAAAVAPPEALAA